MGNPIFDISNQALNFFFNFQPMSTNMIPMQPNQMNTSPQTIPAQVVLQKQQQMRGMHPNMVAQQMMNASTANVQVNTPNANIGIRQIEFRQPGPSNVVLQPNQMQQFQQVN